MRLRQLLDWYHNQLTYPYEPHCGGRFMFVGYLSDETHELHGKVMRIRCVRCRKEKRLFEGIYFGSLETKGVRKNAKTFDHIL